MRKLVYIAIYIVLFVPFSPSAQEIFWSPDGNGVLSSKEGALIRTDMKTEKESVLFEASTLTPNGKSKPINVENLQYSNDGRNILFFTNSAKVWRKNTRGDYWVLNTATKQLTQVGKTLPAQSLMFAKFSPDSRKIAFVSGNNIYVEDVASGISKRLTSDGSNKLINGTFDWVYEEEFGCRDGFRWSPNSSEIAFWQVDARKIGEYIMINSTDSIYSRPIPVEYPKVGTSPSPVKIGVMNVSNGDTRWMSFEGDPQQHYIPRMEWSGVNELIVQRLDRKQQESKLIYCRTTDGTTATFWADEDDAWVDLNSADIFSDPGGFNFINKGQEFLWISEKDGWRHIYKISRDGKNSTLLTPGNYDVSSILKIAEDQGYVYFMASPDNPTQNYLYRVRINKPDAPELVSQGELKGVHSYNFSPNGKLAFHGFSNLSTPTKNEWVTLPDHKPVNAATSITRTMVPDAARKVEFLKLNIGNNIVLDAWISYPSNFNASKKYPILFKVYGEPAGSTVMDEYAGADNFLYGGNMANDGYIYASVDNRGTPMLKGRQWRKSIYRNIGQINIDDYAKGAQQIIAKPFVDKERVAVWGWSGGGSSTLNLLFKYPETFKTGIAIAAVANQLFYDNIYQERYMGLPQENMEDFIKGSPVNNVKGLKGNLLYIHGTADDNVHYSNAEVLIDALVKNNKQFTLMSYPNRDHGMMKGNDPGAYPHLITLFTNFLRQHCPPGSK